MVYKNPIMPLFLQILLPYLCQPPFSVLKSTMLFLKMDKPLQQHSIQLVFSLKKYSKLLFIELVQPRGHLSSLELND